MSVKTVKWLAFGLFASIVINIFLAGHMLGKGKLLRKEPPQRERTREALGQNRNGGDVELPILRELRGIISREDMGDIVATMREKFPDRRESYDRLFNARIELFTLLVADTYDVEAVEAALTELDEARLMTVLPARFMLTQSLPKVSAEDRKEHLTVLLNKEKEHRAALRKRSERYREHRKKPE